MKPVLLTAADPADFIRQQDSAAGQKDSPKEHQGNASRLHSNVEKQPGKPGHLALRAEEGLGCGPVRRRGRARRRRRVRGYILYLYLKINR